MGLFFSNSKKLSQQEIEDALRAATSLEMSDRKAIEQALHARKSGGITKRDIIEVMRDFKQETSDSVNPREAKEAMQQLLEHLDDKD